MSGEFDAILARYGRGVTLYPKNSADAVEGLAFLQPVAEKTEGGQQFLPTALGQMRDERFLYLGSAKLALDEMAYLCCDGCAYDIKSAQLVFLGREPSHWRGVLTVREEAADL